MKWIRKGCILKIKGKRCQLPTLSKVNNKFHLWFSSKNSKGYSEGFLIKFDNISNLNNLKLFKPKKNLKTGNIGSYDFFGVMPMQEVKNYLFFIGWTVRKDVPYFNFTSVAKRLSNNDYYKLGPILGPDTKDQGFSGTFFVQKFKSKYFGYYLSQSNWVKDENENINPMYDIKIAYSNNLIDWTKTNKIAIPLKKSEAGISSATIIKHKNTLHMWFSVRKSKFFRKDPRYSYRIKHAISRDGLKWIRTNYFSLHPSADIKGEEEMVCYPNIIKNNDKILMLYNGNGFGLSGIRLAELDLKNLENF